VLISRHLMTVINNVYLQPNCFVLIDLFFVVFCVICCSSLFVPLSFIFF
jgi:hypothetical protein